MTATSAVVAPAVAGPRMRWFILGSYALLAASTQLLWLTFAPVDTLAAKAMGVDVGLVGDLAGIFPLIYVVLALPTGRWLDASFNRALGLGALLTGAGALVRVFAPTSFGLQLAGQLVVAGGQPLVLNSITKVAARYFPPAQRATAISIGSVALFAGILTAVLTGGPLLGAGGLGLVLLVQAVVALLAMALMLVALREPPAYPDDPSAAVSLRWLSRDRLMWILAALVFIGMGTYNAVATWLQPILQQVGEGGAAGNLVAVMTVGGIIGAAVLPPMVAAHDRRRSMLVASLSFSVLAFLALALRHDVLWVGGWLFAEGVLLMASLPVVLDWSEVHAGPDRQGGATGFLLMAGNLGGLVLVLVTQAVIGRTYLPFIALAIASALGVPLARLLPERSGAAASRPGRGDGG